MTETPSNTITKEQRFAVFALGIPLFLFGVIAAISILLDSVGILNPPQDVTIEEAAEIATREDIYVNISHAIALCDRLAYREGRSSSTDTNDTRYTDIWFVDERDTVGIFATFSGRLTCEDINNRDLTGYLSTVGSSLPRTAGNLPFGNSADYLELCAYCGTSNSIGLLIVFAIAMLFGGLLIYTGLTRPVGPAPETTEKPPDQQPPQGSITP